MTPRRWHPDNADEDGDGCEGFREPLLSVRYESEASGDDERSLGQLQSPVPRSRNISFVLAYTGFAFAGRSLWSQSVLSTFVFLLKGDNAEAVGLITAVQGLSQLLVSIPTGILADAYRRDKIIHTAAVVGVLAIFLSCLAIYRQSYRFLMLALAVWGVTWGMANTALGALFADSIQDGSRSYYFTQRSILIQLGNTSGPLVALFLFKYLGDQWTIHDCAIVMCVGQALCFPAVLLLCGLSDDHAVGGEDEDEDEPVASIENQNDDCEALVDQTRSESTQGEASVVSMVEASSHDQQQHCGCLPSHRLVPVLIASADVISGLGSGMSIRYFPIFFLDSLKLSPVIVQVLYTLAPMGQATLMHLGQIWAKRIGRCRVAVIFKWSGIICMVMMILSYLCSAPKAVICIWFLVRTSFVNSTSALTKSFLMDEVPKRERAKWSSLESVNMFSWSGSAALGGLLVGFKGLLFNFGVTASIQFLATLPLIALFSREKREQDTLDTCNRRITIEQNNEQHAYKPPESEDRQS